MNGDRAPALPPTADGSPPGWAWQPVCESARLVERGAGVRFAWSGQGRADWPAFVVRVDGRPSAFLNRCAHVPVELDGEPGRFFDDAGLYLVCATHGACYDAGNGVCVAGPCRGKRLNALDATEHDGQVWILMNLETR
ncbi:MAG: Rieske 2Fe-2S domain-containing protein [Burkholderiaceae bacterium]